MKIYLVGGAVRDRLLHQPNSDRDYVVVGSSPEEMQSLGYRSVGKDFPVFLHPKTGEEYALARTERKSGHGHTGFVFSFTPEITLEDDLLRRDLTINAIAEDADGTLIDPYGGLEDLQKRVLRHVSPAFAEDPLRVLRVARFAAALQHLGFTVAPETLSLMRDLAESGELSHLTPERIWGEMVKALEARHPDVFITTLRACGALKAVLPEIDALFGVPGPKPWHPEIDSGIHTLMTLRRLSEENTDPVVRFAMLCHDLGKGVTEPPAWPHHTLHNLRGAAPLSQLCNRLKVPRQYYEFARIVVLYHSYMHHVYRAGPEGVVNLFEHLDAFRRPERLKPWLLCCKCDFLGRRGFAGRPFPRSDYLWAAFCLVRTVTAAEFVAQGFKGQELSDQVRLKRVLLMADFFKTIPADELSDRMNEMPPPAERQRQAQAKPRRPAASEQPQKDATEHKPVDDKHGHA